MELQINFIVMMIIAIVVFGFGMTLAIRAFSDATDMKDELDRQAEEEILSYLNSGKVMSIGINRKEMKLGDAETFGLGLINKYGQEIQYYVNVTNMIGVDRSNAKIILDDGFDELSDWTFPRRPETGFKILKNNEKTVQPLVFRVPSQAEKGVYSFTVKVMYKTSEAGAELLFNNQVQKIYIEVI